MKRLLPIVFIAFSANSAYEHSQISQASTWPKGSLNRYQVPGEAYVPITISHKGKGTRYYIEVNNIAISDLFVMEDGETLDLDVPVDLENRHGGQKFRVCSVSLNGMSGSRICTNVELFNLYPVGEE